MTRLLVTNDDGLHAEAIHVLAAALAEASYDVVVVAPSTEMSGAGASMGLLAHHEGIHYRRADLAGGIEAYAVDGPPAACVILSLLGAFGEPPEMVCSGINYGPNTGRSVLHSGTVGAALTAANWGISGLAVSMRMDRQPHHWSTAAELAVDLMGFVADAPARTVVSLNVPDCPRAELAGIVTAPLAPYGSVRTQIEEVHEGFIETRLVRNDNELPPETDAAQLADGYATLTVLDRPAASDQSELDKWLAEQGRLGVG